MNIDVPFKGEFDRLLYCINKAGCSEYVMIIGSWAEYLYDKNGLFEGFTPTMKTQDVDVLIKNLRLPEIKSNLIGIAKENEFLYSEDILDGTSRLVGHDNFEVEFLIAQKGAYNSNLPRTQIGVNAQQLSHLDVLRDNQMALSYDGHLVYVPKPEAYVIQKEILHRDKDVEHISNLFPFLDMEEYTRIKETLTKKEQKLVTKYESEHKLI